MFSQTISFAEATRVAILNDLSMRSLRPVRFLLPALSAALVPLFALPLFAQQPAASANLVNNGGFERFLATDDIWDGVDGDGYLAGARWRLPALAETGLQTLAMPVAVKLVDMNGDNLPDLVTADPIGYYRIYFNSGTATDPKFTVGEIVPVFLWSPTKWGTNRGWNVNDERNNFRRGPNIDVADWTGRGSKDLIVGLYSGEVVIIPNSGSASTPAFQQPRQIETQLVATTSSGRTWGNLFSPIATDWNGDRQIDLLLGEGSYSANAVHVLLNSGSASAPKFTDEGRYYLAYGMGREHLHPALADLNGDGNRDLVVTDRLGEVSLYLNKSSTWKPGDQLEFTSVVSLGGSSSQQNMMSLDAGDFNGDGKIDLVMGKTNGRIAVALNNGTPQEPKFSAATEIKGTDIYKRDLKRPSGWDISTGESSGNSWAVVTAVDAATDPNAAPPEGKFALKAFYRKPLNKVIAPGIVEFPALHGDAMDRYDFKRNARDIEFESGTRTMAFVRSLPALKVGTSYQLTFKFKGNGVRNATYVVGYQGYAKLAPDKVTERGRGVSVQRFEKREEQKETGRFTPGPTWSDSTKTFSVNFKARELKDLKTVGDCKLFINFELTGWDSVLYLDDVRLVAK